MDNRKVTNALVATGRLMALRHVLGLLVVTITGAVMAAWLVRSEILVAATPALGTMVFSTALCLALLGSGVLLLESNHAWSRWALPVLGAVVAALAGLTLAEHLTRVNLGVDMAEWHRWLQTRAPAPGRMAVGTSIALLLLGIACGLWPQAARRRVGLAIQVMVICAMVIALCGLIIREMQLQYLYSPHVLSSMALHTVFGLLFVGTGFWLAWQPASWNRLLTFATDEHRIKSSGTAILLVVAASSGFFGFYVSQDTLEQSLVNSYMQTLRARMRQMETVLEHHLLQAHAISSRLDLQQRLQEASRDAENVSLQQQLATIAESWLPLGFDGVAFHNDAGREVARAGKFVEQTAHALALGKNRRVRLSWQNGFYMRSEIDVFHDNQPVGRIVAEQYLPHLTPALIDVKDFGETGNIELCARIEGRASCFPTRLSGTPYIYPPVAQRQPHPIYRALDGETGHEFGPDYRGTPVFAAYAPIADYGLGMVMKIDASELTAPVRRQLESTLPIVMLFVAMGIALLNYLVHPLAQRLARREQQLKLALDNSGLALWDWDTRNNTVYLSEQWQTILGGKPAASTTTFDKLQKLVHPDDAAAVAEALRHTLKEGGRYDIEHRVRTHNGEWRWIHSVGNVVERDSHGQVLRMNGTNADIGTRKQAEEQLAHQAHHDALTGLPNRILFQARLDRAMARTRRSHTLMAVMYLDIDKFKNINDTLGHAMGDALLKEFARRLAGCVRNVDTVARLGGDEFAVILEHLDEREAGRRIAEKIVTAMRPEFTLEYRTLSITTSVGVAFHQGGSDERSADHLVKKADEALYAAKGAGRNNYQVAT
jgi:diguanylate cyclase (GGDEF)-like protein/PAS domain S-box-containing protein